MTGFNGIQIHSTNQGDVHKHDFFAMTYEEIAELMGTTEGAVKKLQQSAIRKLRERPARFQKFIALVEAARELRELREA
jgi:predicted transcriptional regulator